MKTYRITYKYRDKDCVQAFRPWRHTFTLITLTETGTLDEALSEFKNQDWQVNYIIKEIYNINNDKTEKRVFEA